MSKQELAYELRPGQLREYSPTLQYLVLKILGPCEWHDSQILVQVCIIGSTNKEDCGKVATWKRHIIHWNSNRIISHSFIPPDPALQSPV